MRVAQLWRYPVKSMQGEALQSLELGVDRVPGDREWGVRDSATGSVLTARTAGALLHVRARIVDDGVCITFPDGLAAHERDEHTDLALSSFVGRPVHLAHAKPDEQARFSMPRARWTSVPGSFNDGHPVHVLTTASLRAAAGLGPDGAWDVRRFRPNLLVEADSDDFVEDRWSTIRIGDVVLEAYRPTPRCPITTRSQPGLDDDPDITATLARNRKGNLGVYARVKTAGTIDAGADVVAG